VDPRSLMSETMSIGSMSIGRLTWRVTLRTSLKLGKSPLILIGNFTESQVRWNARTRNVIFDAISEEVFAHVRSKANDYDI
jgi:hypothetical protein